MFTRDHEAAVAEVEQLRANVGAVSKWGRITETLMGAELVEMERGDRPLYRVDRIIHNHDPLFDGNLSREVLHARQQFAAREG